MNKARQYIQPPNALGTRFKCLACDSILVCQGKDEHEQEREIDKFFADHIHAEVPLSVE